MNRRNTHRRTFFIKRGFQAKFVAWVIGLMVFCCLCSGAVLYPLINSEIATQLSAGHRHSQAADRLVLALVAGNLLALLVAAAAAAFVIIYISHKIAGPLFRFQRVCEEIGKGNLDVSATLRETDQLKDLAQAFTGMLASMRERNHKQLLMLQEAREKLDALRAGQLHAGANEETLQSLHDLLTALMEQSASPSSR